MFFTSRRTPVPFSRILLVTLVACDAVSRELDARYHMVQYRWRVHTLRQELRSGPMQKRVLGRPRAKVLTTVLWTHRVIFLVRHLSGLLAKMAFVAACA